MQFGGDVAKALLIGPWDHICDDLSAVHRSRVRRRITAPVFLDVVSMPRFTL
jgi:hypothetical protein